MIFNMKKKIAYLLILIALNVQAQTIPSYKNIKLTATAENPSATKIGTIEADKTFGYIQKSDLLDVIEVASAINLPSPGVAGKIYVTKDNNKIYRWNGTFYDQLAVTDISGKVDKIAGKGLSTEDYTTAEKTKLAGLSNFDPTAINNTLATKVDKISGKGLSTEDYTTAEKNKLAGIQAGATANSTDTQLRDRATHTGTQAISTVMGLQTAIDAKINLTLIGANNGVTPLDPGGKVPFAYLPASLMIYKGMWNPATNTPTLSDGTGVAGWVYKANASGTVDLGSGNIVVVANDFIIHNGTKWEWSSGTDDVVSVNGQQGVVSLNTSHIPEVTNKRYQTDAQQANNNATSPIQGQLDSKQSTLASSTTNIVSGNTLQRAALTGDVSAPLNSNTTTLATVNSNVGTFGNASTSTTQTVNAKGLTTAISNVPIQIAESQVTGLITDLAGKETIIGAKGTAFNKNFGTTIGTVAQGNDSRILNGQAAFGWGDHSGKYPTYNGVGATGTWPINVTSLGGSPFNFSTPQYASLNYLLGFDNDSNGFAFRKEAVKSWLGLGSNAYSSTPYLPIIGYSSASANTFLTNGVYSNEGGGGSFEYSPIMVNRIAGSGSQINVSYNTGYMRTRGILVDGTFTPWRNMWHDGNFNPANYLPLSGGTLTGVTIWNNSAIKFQTASADISLFSTTYQITGSGSTTDFNAYVYGNNSYGIWTNGAKRVTVGGDGNTTFQGSVTSTGFFNQSSDRRLKYIHKRDGDVAYFTWKDGRDDKMHIGWIAQEVRKQFPDQVQKNDDGYLSVSYIEILVAKNRDLEKRLEALENRIEHLKKQK